MGFFSFIALFLPIFIPKLVFMTIKNPFLYTPISTFILREESKVVTYTKSGKTTAYQTLEIELDRDESVKLFKIAEIRELHKLLSKSGMELFLYILGNSMRKNSDTIKLSHRDDHEMPSTSYNRAVKSLVENNLICKKEIGVYWINPHLFYSGSRVKALKEKYGADVAAPVNNRVTD